MELKSAGGQEEAKSRAGNPASSSSQAARAARLLHGGANMDFKLVGGV